MNLLLLYTDHITAFVDKDESGLCHLVIKSFINGHIDQKIKG